VVVAAKKEYQLLEQILKEQKGETSLEQRRMFAITAFDVCTGYDLAISNYFNNTDFINPFNKTKSVLRYGENPHQEGIFYGNQDEVFDKLHGKELSYNNLVDVDAAIQLITEASPSPSQGGAYKHPVEIWFAIIKHTNVCGVAIRNTLWPAIRKVHLAAF
jgi:phosphoribosylaminoimidazolecarboxamide formyltransferase / IMP cyclohydrolase